TVETEPEPEPVESPQPAATDSFEETPAAIEPAPSPVEFAEPRESEIAKSPPQKKTAPPKETKAPVDKMPKQEVLQFEPVTRGRFEKSEPTIVEGEDLDVPTYLRKNIKVK